MRGMLIRRGIIGSGVGEFDRELLPRGTRKRGLSRNGGY